MKLHTATAFLLSISSVSANQCTDKCKNTFNRSIVQILTPCVEACQSGGPVCDNFCEEYVSDAEQCKAIFCLDEEVDKKANLRSVVGNPTDQAVDLGILQSQEVSFVVDSVTVQDLGIYCFYDCYYESHDYFDCLHQCFGPRDSADVSLVKTAFDSSFAKMVSKHHADADDNSYGAFPCFNHCSSIPISEEYFSCLDKCYESIDTNEPPLVANKVEVKEESADFPSPCVKNCRRGGRYDLDCVAACYGAPSYCHYVCFDESRNDAEYRQCVAENCESKEVGSSHLESFAKKISKHVMN